jgi:hypothetical protein
MIAPVTAHEGVVVEIGGMPILLRTGDKPFRRILQERYRGFTTLDAVPEIDFQIRLHDSTTGGDPDAELQVQQQNGSWTLRRGDFLAEWHPTLQCGQVHQSPNPYAIDSVLRIVHSLILAPRGGFLVHAASAIRGGRAFLFAGVSGAGKTTISRLAPVDTVLLSDEISYVRRGRDAYHACGTPFSGELAKVGENVSAPIAAVFLLAKGQQNCIEPINQADAIRSLLRNILFFAEDEELVKLVFQSASDFVNAVPVHRLTFVPDHRVWDLITGASGEAIHE